jgi:hypothetical protein
MGYLTRCVVRRGGGGVVVVCELRVGSINTGTGIGGVYSRSVSKR